MHKLFKTNVELVISSVTWTFENDNDIGKSGCKTTSLENFVTLAMETITELFE